MNEMVFGNEALNFAIKTYLHSKEYPDGEEHNSFFSMVIRALVQIYGELDITNPYKTNNIVGWDNNIKKFGLSNEDLNKFKEQLLLFYQNSETIEIAKEAFLEIQKKLVDMFALKKSQVVVSDEDVEKFKMFLYTKNDRNSFKYALYSKYTPDSDFIIEYFNMKMFETKHHYHFTEYKEIALSSEAYQLAGFNVVEVLNMKDEEIEDINNKVFHFFRIKESDLNKRNRLENAIEYYKKYGNTITSGNGYVDLLLLISVISTILMVAVVIGTYFMR